MGSYKGEKIDRAEFDAMLSRFYELSRLTPDGVPDEDFARHLDSIARREDPTRYTAMAIDRSITISAEGSIEPAASANPLTREQWLAIARRLVEAGTRIELLLRFREESGRIVTPGAFIPAAERYGLMPMIDRWVIDKATRLLTRLTDDGIDVTGLRRNSRYSLPSALARKK